MNTNKITHESYGMLGFARASNGSGSALFGSSIRHNNTIQMTLKTAKYERSLSTDYYFGDKSIVTVEMSPTQFYEAITNMNVSDGVPVTIRQLNGQIMEDCPFNDVKQKFEAEFKESLDNTNDQANEAISQVTDLLKSKKPLNKAERENLLALLNKIQMGISSTAEFIYSQFNEQMDKTVSEAKGEIEAFVQRKVSALGIEGLAKENMVSLENKE